MEYFIKQNTKFTYNHNFFSNIIFIICILLYFIHIYIELLKENDKLTCYYKYIIQLSVLFIYGKYNFNKNYNRSIFFIYFILK